MYLVLKFGLMVPVPELARHIPRILMMYLLKETGDSWVSVNENSSSSLYKLLLLSILCVCVYISKQVISRKYVVLYYSECE